MGKMGSCFDCLEKLFLKFVGIRSVLGLSIAKARLAMYHRSQLQFVFPCMYFFFVSMVILGSALSVTSACGNLLVNSSIGLCSHGYDLGCYTALFH